MPLSEQEQRLLDEMERGLYQNDADFVATVGGSRPRPTARSVALGVLITVVGIGTLLTGVMIRQPLVGILGFVVMFGGVLFVIAPPKRLRGAAAPRAGARANAKRPGGFMATLNDRWDRRTEERGRD
jgi:hypothetical protein